MSKRTTALFVTLVLAALPVYAQNADLDERVKALQGLGKGDQEYRLGAGDLIEIGVFGVEGFRHTIRISASGIVKLPLIDPIMATGLTPLELEQRLTTMLGNGVINDPQVSVFVKEYRSQSVYVLGAVKTPGQYQISLQLRIIDAIAMAGGLQPNAAEEALIQRSSPDGGEQAIKVNLNDLLEKGGVDLNVVIRGGDVIHIQQRASQNVYVVGDVNRAGAFELPYKQDLRVSQAFAWAGGPMKTAKLKDGILVRYDESGQRQQLSVDFGQILKGTTEDFVVRANDIIFVPGSKFKAFSQSMLTSITGMITSIPYRVP